MRDNKIANKERLEHILEAISKINVFIKGQSKESFLNSNLMQDATLYQFTIIGEAVVNIDKELLDKYPYPWHNVRAFRNFILHEYHATIVRSKYTNNQAALMPKYNSSLTC